MLTQGPSDTGTGGRSGTTVLLIAVAAVFAAVWIATITGCSGAGSALMDLPDGTRVEARQPGKATAPATITRGPNGTWTISTGNQQTRTPAMIAASKAWVSYLIAAGLGLVGIGLLVAKKWLPIIPTTAGTWTLLLAGGLIFAVQMAITIPPWVWIALIGIGTALVIPGLISNWRDRKKTTQTQGAST